MERCWFLGPTVISLGTLAERYNISIPWFERMTQSEATPQELGLRAIPEQAVNELVDIIIREQGLSAITTWAEESTVAQSSSLSLHWGERSIADVIRRAAETSLLDNNIACVGTYETADHLTIFLLPEEDTPKWVHLFFLTLMAEGVAKYNDDSRLVEDTGLGGALNVLRNEGIDKQCWDKLQAPLSEPSWVRYKKSRLSAGTVFSSESWARMTRSLLNPIVGLRYRSSSWRYKTQAFFCRELAGSSELNMPKAAEFMNLDVSTLRRHLSAEGTSFRKLLADFRVQLGVILRMQNVEKSERCKLLDFSSSASLKRLGL